MPISVTQAERGLLSAALCLFVFEKAGARGEHLGVRCLGSVVGGFGFNVLLALAVESLVRSRRGNAAWDKCHHIPICRRDGMATSIHGEPTTVTSSHIQPWSAAVLHAD